MSKRTTQFQLEALKKQFPFLFVWPPARPAYDDPGKMMHYATHESPLVIEKRVYSLQVARITRELLALTPKYDGATGSLVDISDDDCVFLLDAQGELLGEVRQDRDVHHNEAHTDHESDEGETVGEAIARMKAQKVCAMILRRRTGFIVRDHHSVGGYEATLYLAPKGWTVADWCAEQQRIADTQIAAQAAEAVQS